MDEMYLCELCRKAYEPEEVNGVKKLKIFRGYTVDLRLQEFRKMEYGYESVFVEFNSPLGKKLLDQMHREVTR